MEQIRAYLLSVAAAAVICGVLRELTGRKGTTGAVMDLLTGLFLAVTVLRPLSGAELSDWTGFLEAISTDSSAIVEEGTLLSRQALSASIKERTEAYILDKAAELSLDISAEVMLDDSMTPVSVIITGDASPYARQRLETVISEELGIQKEAQIWS